MPRNCVEEVRYRKRSYATKSNSYFLRFLSIPFDCMLFLWSKFSMSCLNRSLLSLISLMSSILKDWNNIHPFDVSFNLERMWSCWEKVSTHRHLVVKVEKLAVCETQIGCRVQRVGSFAVRLDGAVQIRAVGLHFRLARLVLDSRITISWLLDHFKCVDRWCDLFWLMAVVCLIHMNLNWNNQETKLCCYWLGNCR